MTRYYAQLDNDNIVTQVITGVNEQLIEGIPADEWYTNYCGVTCVETFYNAPNKTAAGISYTYDQDADVFVAPQPYPSWTLDANHDWQSPTPKPSTGNHYWSEKDLQWVAI